MEICQRPMDINHMSTSIYKVLYLLVVSVPCIVSASPVHPLCWAPCARSWRYHHTHELVHWQAVVLILSAKAIPFIPGSSVLSVLRMHVAMYAPLAVCPTPFLHGTFRQALRQARTEIDTLRQRTKTGAIDVLNLHRQETASTSYRGCRTYVNTYYLSENV